MVKSSNNRICRFSFILLFLMSFALCITGCGKEKAYKEAGIFPVEKEITSKIEYQVNRRENITRNTAGGKVAEICFDSVVFTDKKYEFITLDLEKEKADFFNMYEEGFLETVSYGEESDYRDGYFPYYCTSKVKSVFQRNNYVSILMQEEWYVGGSSQCDLIGYNYSLDTGGKVSIQEICNLNTETILKKINKELEKQNIILDDYGMDSFTEYMNGEIPFYFDDTGIYVSFPKGSISIMADGNIIIPIV